MAFGIVAAGGISAIASGIGGMIKGREQKRGVSRATQAQLEAQEKAMNEQRKQLSEFQRTMQPFTSAGGPAVKGMQDILGIGETERRLMIDGRPANAWEQAAYQLHPFARESGVEDPFKGRQVSFEEITPEMRQEQAISRIEESPYFEAMTKQGEEAILARASATGGLRGGRTQEALAQFRPQMLNQLIQQRYQQLAGLSQLGQASTMGVGQAGLQTGQMIGGILQAGGEARAQEKLARSQISAETGLGGMISGVGQMFGQAAGYGAGKGGF